MEDDDSAALTAVPGDAVSEPSKTKRNAPRKRMRKLFKEIRDQMEFYFSDSNLRRDRYLRKQTEQDADGFVPLEVFQNFNKMKSICTDPSVIAKALVKCSQLLEVSDDGARVRRRTPLRDESAEEVDSRTVYVESLPHDVDHDWIKSVFSDYGKITYVSLPRWKSTRLPKGFAFVEYETAGEADMCCKSLGSEEFGQAHCFPKGSKDFVRLQRSAARQCIEVEPVTSLSPLDATGTAAAADQIRKWDEPSTGDDLSADGEAKPTARKSTMSEDELEEDENKDDEEEDARKVLGNNSRKTKSKLDAGDRRAAGELKPKARKRKMSLEVKEEETNATENANCSPRKKKTKRSKSKHQPARGSAGGATQQQQQHAPDEAAPDKQEACDGSQLDDNACMVSGDEAEGGGAADGKKARRVRKKKSKAAKSDGKINRMEVDTLKLKVIPKSRWLSLRAEYLAVQKVNMAALKKALQRETGSVQERRPAAAAATVPRDETIADDGCKPANEPHDQGTARLPPAIQFVPDVIVSVKCRNGTLSRQRIKACLSDDIEVAYVDIADGAQEGFVRCKTAASAGELCRVQSVDDLTFTAVRGEQEHDYWEKLRADRDKKRLVGQQKSVKKKHRRGTQKLAAKAEKITARTMDAAGPFGASHGGDGFSASGAFGTKHIRFEG